MSNDPHTVSLDKLVAFLRDLGISPLDPRDIKSVVFDSDGVTVTRFRRNAEGRIYLAGLTPATETVRIQLDVGLTTVSVADVTQLSDAEPSYLLNEYAQGGPVGSGQPYIVGEDGPEVEA